MSAAVELRRLTPATGEGLELRARCQDDGHPAGCVHPWLFGHGQPGTVCHCGRVWYRGVREVVSWPRPPIERRYPAWHPNYRRAAS